jgi:hypothetical protein
VDPVFEEHEHSEFLFPLLVNLSRREDFRGVRRPGVINSAAGNKCCFCPGVNIVELCSS